MTLTISPSLASFVLGAIFLPLFVGLLYLSIRLGLTLRDVMVARRRPLFIHSDEDARRHNAAGLLTARRVIFLPLLGGRVVAWRTVTPLYDEATRSVSYALLEAQVYIERLRADRHAETPPRGPENTPALPGASQTTSNTTETS